MDDLSRIESILDAQSINVSLDQSVNDPTDCSAEISFTSDAGESFSMLFSFDGTEDNFVEQFKYYAYSFDPKVYARLCIMDGSKMSGLELFDDVMSIKERLKKAADALEDEEPEVWLLKIGYSWGDEEPDQRFESFEEAWTKAKRMAIDEAETSNIEYGCPIDLSFEYESDEIGKGAKGRISLHYSYDDEYCYYDVIKEG